MRPRPHQLAARMRKMLGPRRGAEPARAGEVERLLTGIDARVTSLEGRLRDVRELAARAYEAPLDWPGQLAAVRSDPRYDIPWEEAEPLVSVRIPTYNNAELLCARTLASLSAQTYERWEAVVVGDAVTDDTARRIESLRDGRIRFINLPIRGPYPEDDRRRRLVAGTRPANIAVRESQGSWIAPLDHDDAFAPDHIEVLLNQARATRAEVAYGRLELRDPTTGERLAEVGAWPPELGQFGFQGAIYHRGLSRFEHDELAYLWGEPGDWNLARRMWEAGVRFTYLDRVVTSYYWSPKDERDRGWLATIRADRPPVVES